MSYERWNDNEEYINKINELINWLKCKNLNIENKNNEINDYNLRNKKVNNTLDDESMNEIFDLIEKSSVILFILTKTYVNTRQFQLEYNHAKQNLNKNIILYARFDETEFFIENNNFKLIDLTKTIYNEKLLCLVKSVDKSHEIAVSLLMLLKTLNYNQIHSTDNIIDFKLNNHLIINDIRSSSIHIINRVNFKYIKKLDLYKSIKSTVVSINCHNRRYLTVICYNKCFYLLNSSYKIINKIDLSVFDDEKDTSNTSKHRGLKLNGRNQTYRHYRFINSCNNSNNNQRIYLIDDYSYFILILDYNEELNEINLIKKFYFNYFIVPHTSLNMYRNGACLSACNNGNNVLIVKIIFNFIYMLVNKSIYVFDLIEFQCKYVFGVNYLINPKDILYYDGKIPLLCVLDLNLIKIFSLNTYSHVKSIRLFNDVDNIHSLNGLFIHNYLVVHSNDCKKRLYVFDNYCIEQLSSVNIQFSGIHDNMLSRYSCYLNGHLCTSIQYKLACGYQACLKCFLKNYNIYLNKFYCDICNLTHDLNNHEIIEFDNMFNEFNENFECILKCFIQNNRFLVANMHKSIYDFIVFVLILRKINFYFYVLKITTTIWIIISIELKTKLTNISIYCMKN